MTEAATKELETTEATFRQAINQAHREEMQRDDDVYLVGIDVGKYGGVLGVTEGLYDEFGDDRVLDTPISEGAIVGTSVGAAATGLRPIAELMFVDFIGVAGEPIINQMAKMRYMFGGETDMPVTVRTLEGGGMQTSAQHSGTLHTWIGHFPGLKAVTPGTAAHAKGLLKSAVRSDDPVFFFENKTQYESSGPVPVDDDYTVPIGECQVVREGSDVTVVGTQRLLQESLSLAEDLEGEVSLEVIDLCSVYPLDHETICESVAKTGRLVIADESPLSYGTHAEIGQRVVENNFSDLVAPPRRVGVPDTHFPFSPPLEDEVLPQEHHIRGAVQELIRA